MQRYRDVVLNSRGEPVPSVSVLVLTYPAGDLADLFSDDAGTVLANPVTSDPSGAFSFKAENGHYSLVISGAGVTTQTVNDVALNDAADAVVDAVAGAVTATKAELAAGSGSNLVTFVDESAGAVPRPVQEVLRGEHLSLLRYLPINYVTDGSVDYTAYLKAWTAAAKARNMVAKGVPGIFAVSGTGLPIVGPFNLSGPGMDQFWIKNPNGNVLRVEGGGVDVDGVSLWSQGGGHAVVQTGVLYQSNWTRHRIRQDATGYSCWDCDGNEYVDVRQTQFDFIHVLGATVPGVNLTAAGGLINDNLFADGRVTNSGVQFFRVRSTTANFQYANTFRNITFEVCRGGNIDLQAAMLFEIDGCRNWDAGANAITDHSYKIARNASGIGAVGLIRNCGRWAGSNAASICDVQLPDGGGGAGITIENCATSGGGDPFTIDCNNNSVVVRKNASAYMSLLNASAAIVAGSSGIQFPGAANGTPLSYYDEGTWTPAIGSAGTFTYTSQAGKWTRIGRQVTVQGYLALATVSGASGTVIVTGLPFAIPNALANYGAVQVTADGLNTSASGQITGNGALNGASLVIQQFSAGVLSDIASALKAGSTLKFSYTYFVS